MTLPTVKVEIGFDLTNNPDAPLFQLDSDVKGRLDNTQYRLGGEIYYDVTEWVNSFNINRGKQPIEQNYTPGQAEVQLNNQNRYFDPLYSSSPYVGNIIPRRPLRISANDINIYDGYIEDWDLVYDRDNRSFAVAKASDALQLFNNISITSLTPPEELSGERINRVLDLDVVSWPTNHRDIDTGHVTVAATDITEATNALQYLQSIAGSDPGSVFIARDGKFHFDDRARSGSAASYVEFGGTAVPFSNLIVNYGSEELFNEIILTRQGGGTVTATDVASTGLYGVRSWDITDSQVSSDAQLVDIAVGLINKYSQPVYRFASLDVYVNKLTSAQQDDVMGLDFGSVCKVTFHPNNIGDPIERYVEVINIEHRVTVEDYIVTLGFDDLLAPGLVLDDAVFGKLDFGALSW